jgi:hypothetical protein
MKTTTVILSGRRIPQEKVKNETTRHNPPTWNRCEALVYIWVGY